MLRCLAQVLRQPAPVLTKQRFVFLSDRELSDHILTRYKPKSRSISNLRGMRIEIREMLSDLRNNVDKAGVQTYTSVISVCARYKNPEAAVKIWLEMVNRKIKPTHFTYVAMASAYASVGKVKEVEQTLAKGGMQSHAAKGVLLRCYAKAKLTNKLMKTLNHFMDHSDFKFTARHAVVIASGQTDPEEAYHFLRKLRSHYGILPTCIICNAAMSACIKAKDASTAEQILKFMQTNNIKKDSSTIATLANVYASVGDFRKLEELIDASVEAGIPLVPEIFSAYLECCCLKTRKIDDIYQKRGRLMYQTALSNGFDQSPHVQSATLRLYIKVKDDGKIEELFNATCSGINRGTRTFHKLYSDYKSGRNTEEKPVDLVAQRQKDLDDFKLTIPAHQLPENVKRQSPPSLSEEPVFSKKEFSEVVTGIRHGDMRLKDFSSPSDTDLIWMYSGSESSNADLPTRWNYNKPANHPKHPLQARGLNTWVVGHGKQDEPI
eukprot:TRINITY_DN16691_c0_g1_i1.p1 TRINITY_DN16691_c0_g1~~TRINITY_DN16691_c0_g1_i1.p1  ORF type:complete len:492 (+),score=29.58 TRINITY_DN16691_c0_g1_i1:46-1521(+)